MSSSSYSTGALYATWTTGKSILTYLSKPLYESFLSRTLSISLPATLIFSLTSFTYTLSLTFNFSRAKKLFWSLSVKTKYHELYWRKGNLLECTYPTCLPSLIFNWVIVILIVRISPTAISFSPSTKFSTLTSIRGNASIAFSTSSLSAWVNTS